MKVRLMDDGLVDGWIGGGMDWRKDGLVSKWISGRMDWWRNGLMEG